MIIWAGPAGEHTQCGIRLLKRRGLRESDTETTASDNFILIPLGNYSRGIYNVPRDIFSIFNNSIAESLRNAIKITSVS